MPLKRNPPSTQPQRRSERLSVAKRGSSSRAPFIDDSELPRDVRFTEVTLEVSRLLTQPMPLLVAPTQAQGVDRVFSVFHSYVESNGSDAMHKELEFHDNLDIDDIRRNQAAYDKLLAMAMATHTRLGRLSTPWLSRCLHHVDIRAVIRNALRT